ncbi:MAG: hypothetical protein V7K98_15615 [Nostoc sp.]|uniref:hypothetical protein n=1 Tax=Nostoc sp. TaxID=1180 RepID=UPI002FFD4CBB
MAKKDSYQEFLKEDFNKLEDIIQRDVEIYATQVVQEKKRKKNNRVKKIIS